MSSLNLRKIRISLIDIIRIAVSLIILGLLLFLKDIFPNNQFVVKYFYGPYGILWIILFFIVFFKIEFWIARKRQTEKKDEK